MHSNDHKPNESLTILTVLLIMIVFSLLLRFYIFRPLGHEGQHKVYNVPLSHSQFNELNEAEQEDVKLKLCDYYSDMAYTGTYEVTCYAD